MSAHSFVPENKLCECGGRIDISERRKERQENLWRCVRCDRVYSKEEYPEREKWLQTIMQIGDSRKKQVQDYKEAVANEITLISKDPSEENQQILNTLIADYRRVLFEHNHPIASKLISSVKRERAHPSGPLQKNPVLSVLIKLAVSSGTLTKAETLRAAGKPATKNQYPLVNNHIKAAESSLFRMDERHVATLRNDLTKLKAMSNNQRPKYLRSRLKQLFASSRH